MRSVHGADKLKRESPSIYLADEVRRVYEGMMVAISPL